MQTSIYQNEIVERLKKIFREYFKTDISICSNDDLDKELLGKGFMFTATDLLYLFFDIEKEFAITIPQEDIAVGRFNTFNNIVEIIAKQLDKE